MSVTDTPVRIKMTSDLREWLQERAAINLRSLGAEIAILLRERKAAEIEAITQK